jgi:hypothetical protein
VLAISTPWWWVRGVGLAGAAVVVLHLIAAIVVGGGDWRDVGTLAVAPFYVLWKLMLIPKLVKNARSGNAWVRTKRNAEGELVALEASGSEGVTTSGSDGTEPDAGAAGSRDGKG